MSDAAPLSPPSTSSAQKWFIAFVCIGIGLRLLRYLVDMPLWGDEAFVGLNILNRSYGDLLKPLDYAQVAPLGFLFSQRAAYGALGMSEYAMRLLPMLAGVGGFVLFAYWARLLATPAAAAIAVGVMAVSNYSIRYAVELKPYGYDFFASLILLVPATLFLLTNRRRWLALLIAIVPMALSLSFPAVFIAGGIALALLASVGRARPATVILTVLYGVVLVGCFAALMKLTTAGQYQLNQANMTQYWKDAFPPANPLRLLLWLLQVHTGNMFAYPFGAKNGLSAINFLVFLVGLRQWIKTRRGDWAVLLVAPFALTFVAAVFRRYPYGDSARIEQHLAPAIVLLIGVGAAWLIENLPKQQQSKRLCALILCCGLLALGGYFAGYYCFHPYQTWPDAQARKLVRGFLRQATPQALIVVLEPRRDTQPNFQWYLRERQSQITWDGEHDRAWQSQSRPLVVASTVVRPGLEEQWLRQLGRKPSAHVSQYVHLGPKQAPPDYFEAFAFPAVEATSPP
ncbi:MAG: hypothetical protein ABR964_00965 [Tepidisphaeraceae bacterium]